MKNKNSRTSEDDLRDENDFSTLSGVEHGKYADRYREGTNIVMLDPDVAAAFPNDKAVNNAFRQLMKTQTD